MTRTDVWMTGRLIRSQDKRWRSWDDLGHASFLARSFSVAHEISPLGSFHIGRSTAWRDCVEVLARGIVWRYCVEVLGMPVPRTHELCKGEGEGETAIDSLR